MKKTLFLAVFAVASSVLAQTNSVVAPGAKLELLSDTFQFTEGPTGDAAGNLFFVDQPNDRIMEWSTDGKLSTFLQPSGHANGMCFDRQGNLMACADEHNELWSIAPDKKVTVRLKNYQGKYLNGPNDVWVAPNGDMYITDPFYKRTWWDHDTMALTNEEVYFLAAGSTNAMRVTEDLRRPNGITGTPDGHKLFVSDIGAGKTWVYDIKPNGTLGDKSYFCGLGSDGMTIDAEGNVYLTGRGVTVFDRTGKEIAHIEVPEKWTANVCFAGKDRKTLFITASKSLYSIRMQVAGANPAK